MSWGTPGKRYTPPSGIKDPYGSGLSVDEAHAKYDTPAMREHLGYPPEGAVPLSSLPENATGREVALPGNPGVRATGQQGYFEDHGPGNPSQVAGLNGGQPPGSGNRWGDEQPEGPEQGEGDEEAEEQEHGPGGSKMPRLRDLPNYTLWGQMLSSLSKKARRG